MSTVTYCFNGYDAAIAWETNPHRMVDCIIGTYNYAKTVITHKIQLCNSNTCHGIILGDISKVEVRLYKKYRGVSIIPVFKTGDGDEHSIGYTGSAVWTSWFNITTDTNAPAHWAWNDVEWLKCNIKAEVITDSHCRVYKVEIRVTYNTDSCGSCNTFSIAGDIYTVDLKMPHYNGEDNKISKDINRFNFWSGNYDVNDDGINSQPLVLTGVEFASCDHEYVGLCFGECAPFNLYFNMKFTNKFRFIMEMSDNNEEVTISGLGDCMDAVYIIKHFSYKTVTPRACSWRMTLEKVR